MSYTKVQALLSKGVSRPTMYHVIVPRMSGQSQEQLTMLVKNTQVPEVSINTITANGHDAQGVVRECPAHVIYGKPFTITVIADRDYTVYKDMRKWFDSIVKNANPFELSPLERGQGQRAEFYDTITSDIELIKLENNRGATLYSPFSVVFNKAYPVRIGELTLASDAFNTLMEFQIDFYYETYSFDDNQRVYRGDEM